jgi:hypothetical protein
MAAQLIVDAGIRRLLDRLTNPDLRFLMTRWEAIVTEDHTKANLAGLDKNDVAYPPVTYRGGASAPEPRRNRYNRGVGPALTGTGDNLSSSEYRRLTGPPLAPRLKDSRIIANFATRSGKDGDTWFVEAVLVGIVSKKGTPFMKYHFAGSGRLPKRDDQGVRRWGIAECRKAAREELRKIIRRDGQ